MRLLVIDGNSIVNRAFYGIRGLTNVEGLHTNAVYGFMNILLKTKEDYPSDAVCVCFDTREPTFRHKKYEGYKSKRTGMPEELAEQIPVLKEMLDLLHIPRYELPGYEADDLVGTIAERCSASGWECVILSGDKDSFQLVDDRISVLHVSTTMGKANTVLYTPDRIKERYGFGPEHIVDLKALMGDSSDEIPGVAGVGEKTALDLVGRFGGLDDIYSKLSELDIKDSVRKKLIAGEDDARMSYELAKIDRAAPIDFNLEDTKCKEPDNEGLYRLFTRLNFKTLISRMGLEGESSSDLSVKAGNEVFSNYELVASGALDSVIKTLETGSVVYIAVPSSLDAVALSIDGKALVVSRYDQEEESYNAFLHLLFSAEVKKAAHDIKPIMSSLLERGIDFGGFTFDTAQGAYILNPSESTYTMERVAMNYLHCEIPPASVYNKEDAFLNLEGREQALDALAKHAMAVAGMHKAMAEQIRDNGMENLYYNVELPLARVLAEMQHTGFMVDKTALKEFGEGLARRISECEKKIYEYAGTADFNIGSTKQLGELLFEKLRLPVVKKNKTGYSTDIEVLEHLKGYHPIIGELIEYRQLTKLKSTYADGLMKTIKTDGRIHSNFNMTATATGRISSTEPNLQNIPIRQDLGSEIRRMFIPGRPDWVLIDADYSQIELRILAHLAEDPEMSRAFAEDEDIHTVTASQVFGVSPEMVTPLMRRHAKAVNFGIVYGISDFSLSKDIGVTRKEAKRYMDSYFAKYAGVRRYMDNIIKKAKEDGYVTTLMGRRRYIPEIRSSNFNIRSFGERLALNTPVQGTAADVIKLAMVKVRDRLRNEGFTTRLILQVHDELILEGPQEECERAMKLLTEEMEQVVSLSVPLKADASYGKNWMDAKG